MSIELKRMSPSRAAYFMERFKREEKLLGPNEQAALTYVIDMLEKTAAIHQAEAQATQAVPMTDEEATTMIRETVRGNAIRREGSTSLQIVRATEAHHGITAQAKKENE